MLVEAIQGSRYTGLTLSSASPDTTSLIDTGLASLPSGADNDFCLGWYAIITGSAGEVGESSRVSTYSASGTDITLATALTGTPSSGETFDLCRYDPSEMHTALNRALELLYPYLAIPQGNETLFVDNLLLNPDGETYSTTFTNWTHTVATWTQDSSRKIHGSYSFKGVGGGAAAQLTQNLFSGTNIHDVAGKTLYAKGWVWASAASTARLRVTFDGGSTFTNGDYHAGSSEWEGPGTQYIRVAVPTTATSMTVYLEVAAGGTAYFDCLVAYIDPVYRYTIPTAILKGPYTLSVQGDENEPNGRYLPVTAWYEEEDSSGRYIVLDGSLTAGMGLRLDGYGLLTLLSTAASSAGETGTTEVDAPKTHLVVAKAAQFLYEQLGADSGALDASYYQQEAARWEQKAAQLLGTPGMRNRRRAARTDLRWEIG